MPDMPRRMMCIPVDIPSKYFPIILYALFCLFSGLQLDFAVSMLVGYLSHLGYTDKATIATSTLQQMETTGCLSSMSRYII
jgi:uncharacterized membrane protein